MLRKGKIGSGRDRELDDRVLGVKGQDRYRRRVQWKRKSEHPEGNRIEARKNRGQMTREMRSERWEIGISKDNIDMGKTWEQFYHV